LHVPTLAGLQDLPPELILEKICLYLSGKDVWSVCFVSRYLLAIAERLLYYSPCVKNEINEDAGLQLTFPMLRRFACQVIKHPEYARLVRHLTLELLGQECDRIEGPDVLNEECEAAEVDRFLDMQSADERQDLGVVMAAMAEKNIPNALVVKTEWMGEVVVLLHYLPNLRSLTFDTSAIGPLAHAAMERVAGGVPAGLRSMAHLDLRYAAVHGTLTGCERTGFCSDAIVPFMHLPNLTTLSVDDFGGNIIWSMVGFWGLNALMNENDVDDVDGADDAQEVGAPVAAAAAAAAAAEPPEFRSAFPLEAALIQPGCSPITNLSFTSSFAGSRLLNSILTLPRALEEFEYELGPSDVPAPPFMTIDLLPGLRLHKNTLTHLTLSDLDVAGASFATEGIMIGSLTEFTALTHLRLPLMLLIGRPLINVGFETPSPLTDPIGPLLPSSLVSFELDLMEHYILELCMTMTGFPDSWLRSKRCLQNLESFTVYRTRYQNLMRDDQDLLVGPLYPNLKERFEAAEINIEPPLG